MPLDDLWLNRLVFLATLEARIFHLEVGEALEELAADGKIIKLGDDRYKANRVKFILSPG